MRENTVSGPPMIRCRGSLDELLPLSRRDTLSFIEITNFSEGPEGPGGINQAGTGARCGMKDGKEKKTWEGLEPFLLAR